MRMTRVETYIQENEKFEANVRRLGLEIFFILTLSDGDRIAGGTHWMNIAIKKITIMRNLRRKLTISLYFGSLTCEINTKDDYDVAFIIVTWNRW